MVGNLLKMHIKLLEVPMVELEKNVKQTNTILNDCNS